MGYYVLHQTGNWSAAGTWRQITNATDFGTNFTTGTQTLSNTTFTSRTFTAPSLIANCIGTLFGVRNLSLANTNGTIAITLQHDIGAGFVDTLATKTINISTLATNTRGITHGIDPFVVKVTFPTPHTFVTTTADKHRFKVVVAGMTTAGASFTLTNATNLVMGAVIDTNGVPTSTDSVYVCGEDANTQLVVTVDDTSAIAGSHLTTVSNGDNIRSANSLSVSLKGKVIFSRVASATLTVFNSVQIAVFGMFDKGTSASPIPTAYTAKTVCDMTRTSGTTYTFRIVEAGWYSEYGSPAYTKSNYKTTIGVKASGVGTAASPFIVDTAVDWSVNDLIVIPPSSDRAANYNETEYKYIKTKNSPTSYVLSDTVGGAEAGTTYSRDYANIPVLNVTRNCQWDWVQSGVSKVSYDVQSRCNPTYTSGAGDLAGFWMNWVEFKNNRTVIPWNNYYGTNAFQYLTFTTCRRAGIAPSISVDPDTAYSAEIQDIVQYKYLESEAELGTAATGPNIAATGVTIRNFYYIDIDGMQFTMSAANNKYINLNLWGCQKIESTAGRGPISVEVNANCIVTGVEMHCHRLASIYSSTGAFIGRWYSCNFGTKGKLSGAAGGRGHIEIPVTTSVQLYMDNCTFDSNTITHNASGYYSGSNVILTRLSGTINNNYLYGGDGVMQATGASLSDTTIRTSSSLAIRMEPYTNGNGPMTQSFTFLVRPSQALGVFGYAKKNASMVGTVCKAKLYLPGSTTADAEAILTDDQNWNLWALNADYVGSVPAFARIDIIIPIYVTTGVFAVTSGKYLYIDDLKNGNNVLTSLDAWGEQGLSPLMTEELGNAREVWDVVNSGFAAGTMGQLAADTRIAADDATIFALSR